MWVNDKPLDIVYSGNRFRRLWESFRHGHDCWPIAILWLTNHHAGILFTLHDYSLNQWYTFKLLCCFTLNCIFKSVCSIIIVDFNMNVYHWFLYSIHHAFLHVSRPILLQIPSILGSDRSSDPSLASKQRLVIEIACGVDDSWCRSCFFLRCWIERPGQHHIFVEGIDPGLWIPWKMLMCLLLEFVGYCI